MRSRGEVNYIAKWRTEKVSIGQALAFIVEFRRIKQAAEQVVALLLDLRSAAGDNHFRHI